MKLNKILICDGSYLLQRALHTPGLSELSNTKGEKTGGIFGFLKVFQAEMKHFPEYYPVVSWDGGLSPRRTAIYSDYKANRRRLSADMLLSHGISISDEYLEEYHRQRSILIQLLGSIGITSLLLPKWEGDDLQYLLTLICNQSVIVSDDKDMIQLVAPNVQVRRPMRKELIKWDSNDDYNCHPRFTIRKAIIGDESDNIPQVSKGIGEKTADKIALLLVNTDYNEYKNRLNAYIETHNDSLVPRIQSILDNWNQFLINYQLIDLRLVEIPNGFEKMIQDAIILTAKKIDVFKAYHLLSENGIDTVYPDQVVHLIANAKTFLESAD